MSSQKHRVHFQHIEKHKNWLPIKTFDQILHFEYVIPKFQEPTLIHRWHVVNEESAHCQSSLQLR